MGLSEPESPPRTYATWDPASKSAKVSLAAGNLQQTNFGGGWNRANATITKSTGKWYWEISITSLGNDMRTAVGATLVSSNKDSVYAPAYWNSLSSDMSTRSSFFWGDNAYQHYGQAFGVGSTVSVLLDLDSHSIQFYRDCVDQGLAYSGLAAGEYTPFVTSPSSTRVTVTVANFGATAFRCPVPQGYNAGLF